MKFLETHQERISAKDTFIESYKCVMTIRIKESSNNQTIFTAT